MLTSLLPLVFFLCLTSCATLHQNFNTDDLLVYTAEDDETLARRYLPVFIIENPAEKHNRIGTPRADNRGKSESEIFIATEKPTIYTETRTFTSAKDSYTNVIYRIHFEKIPFSILPFYLSSGKNVGLIVVVTLNSKIEPILYTTVHTCGCYLAFVPTSYMPKDLYPGTWNTERQNVYGEVLTGFLDFKDMALNQATMAIVLRNNTHRVKEMYMVSKDSLVSHNTAIADIQPLTSLQDISSGAMEPTSFYRDFGHANGYVKESSKPWERLFISWWAFDWKVGQDKKFGRDTTDGPVFYTSLKPWARNESDMRDYLTFLHYWGWDL